MSFKFYIYEFILKNAKEEVDMALNMGAKCITLGNRILRTETAGLAILSIIMFEVDE